MKKNLGNLLEELKEKKDIKIKNDELIKTLMNFSVFFFVLAILPLLPNLHIAQVVLPSVFAFSPTLTLAYFIIILLLYHIQKHNENRDKKKKTFI